MLETAPSEVASRFPRNCSLSQPVSKAWKLQYNQVPKIFLALRATPYLFFIILSSADRIAARPGFQLHLWE
mgnify:CR=1 FL=1